ncbi:hypothetical protein TorRG33x02_344130 [Trema orientale]|uniref:Uncharacterized protein n=1 Tax=Trema orientale TaxID=63057 RepID=A0A2P5AQQ4_TREOI|nr:hypothetical protein TorRG33x02_344130 [Trema orientale]
MKKIQDSLIDMNEGDKRRFSSILEYQEGSNMTLTKDNRIKDVNQNSTGKCSKEAFGIGAAACTDSPLSQKSVGIDILDNNNVDSCVSESASSKSHSAVNTPCISADDVNENHATSTYTLNSESSTTQDEASKDPGQGRGSPVQPDCPHACVRHVMPRGKSFSLTWAPFHIFAPSRLSTAGGRLPPPQHLCL